MKRVFSVLLLATVSLLAQEGHNADKNSAARPGEHKAHAPEGGEGAGQGDGGGHGADPMQITWKWVNFAILAGGLGYLAFKTGGPFFRERTAAIQEGIREAAAVKADAERRAAEIERRVSNLSQEIERLRAESKQEIAAEGARMRSDTEQALLKIQKNAEAEIASATKHARQELKVYSAELALDLARGQIQNRMSPEHQDKLVGAFVKDLKGKGSLN